MEDIAFITALNHSGSFGENFVIIKKKKSKKLFTRLGRFVWGKPVPEVLSPIWTSTLANNIYLLLKGAPRPIHEIISCNGADTDINRYSLRRVRGMFKIEEMDYI